MDARNWKKKRKKTVLSDTRQRVMSYSISKWVLVLNSAAPADLRQLAKTKVGI